MRLALCTVVFFQFITSGWAEYPFVRDLKPLLEAEPFTPQSWPVWKKRLQEWEAEGFFETSPTIIDSGHWMRKLVVGTRKEPRPPQELVGDAWAWYLLAHQFIGDPAYFPEKADEHHGGPRIPLDTLHPNSVNAPKRLQVVERLLREALRRDPQQVSAHLWLATVLLAQEDSSTTIIEPHAHKAPFRNRIEEAENELALARKYSPTVPVRWVSGEAAYYRMDYNMAERTYTGAVEDDPTDRAFAYRYSRVIILNRGGAERRSIPLARLVERFPSDPMLWGHLAYVQYLDLENRNAFFSLMECERLGGDANEILMPHTVDRIRGYLVLFLVQIWILLMLGFVLVTLGMIQFMTFSGIVLGWFTRGSTTSGWTEDEGNDEVKRTLREKLLARIYPLCLYCGLLYFYLAIPFFALSLLGGMGFLVGIFLSMDPTPVRYLVITLCVGLGSTYAVIRGLFVRPPSARRVVAKTREATPRLHSLSDEVALRVGAEPIDEISIHPGGEIRIVVDGRGPFGIFGIRRTTLVFGIATMRFLSVHELRAILAQRYANHRHHNRLHATFIQRVRTSIGATVDGMQHASGHYGFYNPYYWLIWVYFKAFRQLSAGYSRSREFLSDRVAATIYGSEVTAAAFMTLETEGRIFEASVERNLKQFLRHEDSFSNIYQAFQTYHDRLKAAGDLKKVEADILANRTGFFSVTPSLKDRLDAIQALPGALLLDLRPAMSLFENAEMIEREMSAHLRRENSNRRG